MSITDQTILRDLDFCCNAFQANITGVRFAAVTLVGLTSKVLHSTRCVLFWHVHHTVAVQKKQFDVSA